MSEVGGHLYSIVQTLETLRSGEKLKFVLIIGEYHRAGLFARTGAEEHTAVDAIVRSITAAGVGAVVPKALQKAEAIRKRINTRRKALIPKIKKIIADLDNEVAYISKIENEFVGEPKAAVFLSEIVEQGRAFSTALEALSVSFDQPGKADKTNHLANLFVKSLRREWTGLTGTPTSKDGGKELRELAAAIWSDFDMPCDPSFQDENLDRWLGRRFSETYE